MTKTYLDSIRERLQEIPFPAHLLVFGPERTDRTRYRREHCGCFGVRSVETLDDAAKFVESLNYEGHLSEMTFVWSASEFNEI